MSIANIKNRLVKLEQQRDETETPAPAVHIFLYPKDDMIPDVFDRPLEQWEIFKKQLNSDKLFPSIAVFAVDVEASLRGGNLPLCSVEKYDAFLDAQDRGRRIQRVKAKEFSDGLNRVFKEFEKKIQCQQS